MKLLFVDYETHYSKDYSLRGLTPPEYILHDKFEVHFMAAFDPNWDKPRIVPADEIPSFLQDYPPEQTTVVSHNALFDLSILSWRYNYVPALLQDTLGMSRALLDLPHYDLGTVASVLGLGQKTNTIHKTSGLHLADMPPELLREFVQYALRDVIQCAGIYVQLYPKFPALERRIMDLVLRCAIQPRFHADVKLLKDHLFHLRRSKLQWLREAGYDKAQLMSTARFQEALEELGVEIEYKKSPTGNMIPCFAKTDAFMARLAEYCDGPDDDTNYRVQVLAAARLAHRSTIEETRAERFLSVATLPWRTGPVLPIALRYGGAHTHRLSGEWRMNLQNLPRDKTKSRLRNALIAPAGQKVIAADLSQIEARLTALFCGQDDLVEQFRNGIDVYADFAGRIFGYVVNKTGTPIERFIGKVSILSLSYGAGAERFYQMVTTQARQAGLIFEFSPELAERIVRLYRETFSNIPRMWRTLDNLIISTLCTHNGTQEVTLQPVKITSSKIHLPNGLDLRYNPDDTERLWGSKSLENIIQSLARNVVMESAVQLADRGLKFALQSHDELVFLVDDDKIENAKNVIQQEMTRTPTWMPGLPVAVEIGVGNSYGSAK